MTSADILRRAGSSAVCATRYYVPGDIYLTIARDLQMVGSLLAFVRFIDSLQQVF
jgi:hypothetical protein